MSKGFRDDSDGFVNNEYDHVWKGEFECWNATEVNKFKTDNKIAIYEFLLSHESDIANGINDFGELKGFFNQIFARDANA